MSNERAASVIFAGAGPGGLGPLVCAAQQGKLEALLDQGVVILDRAGTVGSGRIGRYALNADSAGASFLECTDNEKLRRSLGLDPLPGATLELEPHRNGHPPLAMVAAQQRTLGAAIERLVRAHPACDFFPRTTLESLQIQRDETIALRVRIEGETRTLRANNVVLALGGAQRWEHLLDARLPGGLHISDLDRSKIVRADTLFTSRGAEAAGRRLRRLETPRAAILGGSHSAFSVAWTLLERTKGVGWTRDSIHLLYREMPNVFYPSADEARDDGYGFDDQDICPKTKRVHRLGGLKADGRALWRRVTERPGTVPERRVKLSPIVNGRILPDILRAADLIVPAFGYRPRTVPVYGPDGEPIELAVDHGGAHVDDDCRIRCADESSLQHVFGIGLASGFMPSGNLGGEPAFRGQTNGVWLYQNGIGARVLEGLALPEAVGS